MLTRFSLVIQSPEGIVYDAGALNNPPKFYLDKVSLGLVKQIQGAK